MRKKSFLTELFLSTVLIGSSLGLTSDLQAQETQHTSHSSSVEKSTPTTNTYTLPNQGKHTKPYKVEYLRPLYKNKDKLAQSYLKDELIGESLKDVIAHCQGEVHVEENKLFTSDNTKEETPKRFTEIAHETTHTLHNNVLKWLNRNYPHQITLNKGLQNQYTRSGWEVAYFGKGKIAAVRCPENTTFSDIKNGIPNFIKQHPHYRTSLYQDKILNEITKEEETNVRRPITYLINEGAAHMQHIAAIENYDRDPLFERLQKENVKIAYTDLCGEMIIPLLVLAENIQKPTAYKRSIDRQQTLAVIKAEIETLAEIYQEGLNYNKYPQLANYKLHLIRELLFNQDQDVRRLRASIDEIYGPGFLASIANKNSFNFVPETKAPPHLNENLAKNTPPPYEANGTTIYQNTTPTYSSNGTTQHPNSDITITNAQGIVINSSIPAFNSGIVISSHPIPHQGFTQTIESNNFTSNQTHFNSVSSYPTNSYPSVPIVQYPTYSATIANQNIQQFYSASPPHYSPGY